MRYLTKTLLTGLLTLLPALATAYLLYWLAVSAESALANLFAVEPLQGFYFPGLGVALGLVLLFLVGLVMKTIGAQRLWSWAEGRLMKLPLVRPIYGGLRDFTDYFRRGQAGSEGKVVALEVAPDTRMVAFLMGDSPPETIRRSEKDEVVVYIPMSYQVGGHTLVVPRERIELLDMPFDEAMRFVLTAGIGDRTDR